MYEVEFKFPVADPSQVVRRLETLGARFSSPCRQIDEYFAHPSRDFGATDEAFRIRSIDDDNRMTYKGPIVDPVAKTRKEIELGFEGGAEQRRSFRELLMHLGFQPVRCVAKQRTVYSFEFNGRPVELTVDRVDGLGNFVEIETIASESERDLARDCLLDLAAELELTGAIRKSYLVMLMEQDADDN